MNVHLGLTLVLLVPTVLTHLVHSYAFVLMDLQGMGPYPALVRIERESGRRVHCKSQKLTVKYFLNYRVLENLSQNKKICLREKFD